MTLAIVFLLTFFGCAVALPVKTENRPDHLVGVRAVLLEGATELDKSNAESQRFPVLYTIFYSPSSQPKDDYEDEAIEKREVKEEKEQDLETAAGTYALRPLFVYRQQLAYRQRVREASRGRNSS